MLPCARRNEIKQVGRDGTSTTVCRCAHVDCERFTQLVTESDCAGCVMRVPSNKMPACVVHEGPKDFAEPHYEIGLLVYPRTGWEPPRVPYGFERTDDPWVFRPLWATCADRQFNARKLSCGCIELDGVCASKQSGREGQLVVLQVCEACPVRRAK